MFLFDGHLERGLRTALSGDGNRRRSLLLARYFSFAVYCCNFRVGALIGQFLLFRILGLHLYRRTLSDLDTRFGRL